MGLITRLVMLPLAPVEGLLWITRVMQQVAERELNDPASLRTKLEEAERAHARGELSDADLDQVQDVLFQRLVELEASRG